MDIRVETKENGFSLCARLRCPVSEARCLAVTAASWVREAAGGEAFILWPNRVLRGKEPVCSLQCRATGDNEIMLTFEPSREVLGPAAEGFAGRVAALAERDLAGYPENRPELIAAYCAHCRTVMKYAEVTYRGLPLRGFAFAVDKHGGLMVMTQESRTVVTVYGGEARLIPKEEARSEPPELPVMPH